MKECCEKYVHQSEPKKPQNTDFFYEEHKCTTCGQKLRIKFQRVVTFESTEFVPISSEVIK